MTVIRKKQAAFFQLEKVLLDLTKNQNVKVGYFENAKYPARKNKIKPGGQEGLPVATVAAIQELGYAPKNIPPRPTLKPTVEEKKTAISNIARNGLKKIAKGEWKTKQMLDYLGQKIAGEVRKSISRLTSPALKESTVLARSSRYAKKIKGKLSVKQALGISKPLVDTRTMINHVTSIVEDE